MIELLFIRALRFLKLVPREIWYVLIVAAAFWVWGNHRHSQGYDKRTDEYADIARQAAAKAEKGNQAALVAVEATKGAVEAENEAARRAAEGSDDPFKSAMDVLP